MARNYYDDLHAKNLDKYINQLRAYYLEAIKLAAPLIKKARLNRDGNFYFRGNPELNSKINSILLDLNSKIKTGLINSINSEWDLAVAKNNALAYEVFGDDLDKFPAAYRNKILSTSSQARLNFLQRKEGGLNLSDRVWNNTKKFKTELEIMLELGIGEGASSARLAQDLTQYLNNPNKLFRRVRDQNNVLRLSKNAKLFNPGRGVYRSSYKNAFRLVRNETNFSYEGANLEKRKSQNFIVGINIAVSPAHDPSLDKGGVKCIDLQGNYPKNFNFTYKWHVNCLCVSTNIIKTKEEIKEDVKVILKGDEPGPNSVNTVKTQPEQFTKYLKDNNKKWAGYKTYPRTFDLNK